VPRRTSPARLAAAEREAQRRVQDEANNAPLLQRLQGQPDRRAAFVCTLVAVRSADDPEPLVAAAGRSSRRRAGRRLRLRPADVHPGLGKTVAELPPRPRTPTATGRWPPRRCSR
jgi:XTP/dITP diphosphohydrolase